MGNYDKPMTAMLPVMVYQTRLETTACHGFAEIYENQPHNYDLNIMPPLDGERHGAVLTCIDRSKPLTAKYGHHIECPPGSPEYFCGEDGYMYIGKVHTYHGMSVYSNFLTEPSKNMAQMRNIQWVDLQSDNVAVSTLVYTEGMEIFTSIEVVFSIDQAGRIVGHNYMISYVDLVGQTRKTFLTYLVVVVCGSFLGTVLSLYELFKNPHCKWGLTVYEIFSRVFMFVYTIVLMITYQQQIPMSEEYDHLLHSVLDFHGHSAEEWENLQQNYFDVLTHIFHETEWLMTHRIVIYILLYVQLMQVIFYFDAHPRMAVLTSTVHKAVDLMFHFFLIFGVLFTMLAFMASWLLGSNVLAFSTFAESVSSQAKMLFGEWIYAANADELFGAMSLMYWLYAMTFMLILFFTLLNFFLAIILDAFIEVKEAMNDDPTEQNFFVDCWDVLYNKWMYYHRGWPHRIDIMKALEKDEDEEDEDDRIWRSDYLSTKLPGNLQLENDLLPFLRYYVAKCEEILSPNAAPARGDVQVHHEERNGDEELQVALQHATTLMRPHFPGQVPAKEPWTEHTFKVGEQELHTLTLTMLDPGVESAQASGTGPGAKGGNGPGTTAATATAPGNGEPQSSVAGKGIMNFNLFSHQN